MQLTVRDASRLLNTLETTIYRWIKQGRLPASRLQHRFRFNRAELLEWATSRQLPVSPDIFELEDEAGDVPVLSEALRAGGVFHRVPGADRSSVLRAIVELMPQAEGVDRELLLSVFLARTTSDATAIRDGIAIPHVRNPVVLPVDRPLVSLYFLERPVDFGAVDGTPVFVVCSVITPTVRAHLRLLSQLSFALRDPDFRAVLERRGGRDEYVNQLRRIEARLTNPT